MASKESIPKKAQELVKERRANNDKIVIWKNGQVVRISARKI
jgi:hypothetical protein